jgi:hypothetical protein
MVIMWVAALGIRRGTRKSLVSRGGRAGAVPVAQEAERHGLVEQLGRADDDGARRSGAVGGLHLGPHRLVAVGPVAAQPGGAELGRDVEGDSATGDVDDEHIEAVRRRIEDGLGVAGDQEPLDARGEPDAWGRLPAELADETVVATSAEHGRLSVADVGGDELERGVGVVVEAAHEAGRHRVGDAEPVEAVEDPVVVRLGLRRQVVGDLRGVDDHRSGGLRLRVEDPHRVPGDPLLVIGCELGQPAAEVPLEHGDVGGPVIRGAHRVDLEVADEAEGGQELRGDSDDLDVEVRVGGPDRLDADLVVLAEAAGLHVLVAERRRGVPDLPRGERLVLDEGPDR